MSLESKLAEIRANSAENFPADVLEKMSRATAELRESGLGESALSVGAKMPPFVLSDTEGEMVDSNHLLERGPLVVTFYRGTW